MINTRASKEKHAGWKAAEVRFVLRKGWKVFRSPKEWSFGSGRKPRGSIKLYRLPDFVPEKQNPKPSNNI